MFLLARTAAASFGRASGVRAIARAFSLEVSALRRPDGDRRTLHRSAIRDSPATFHACQHMSIPQTTQTIQAPRRSRSYHVPRIFFRLSDSLRLTIQIVAGFASRFATHFPFQPSVLLSAATDITPTPIACSGIDRPQPRLPRHRLPSHGCIETVPDSVSATSPNSLRRHASDTVLACIAHWRTCY